MRNEATLAMVALVALLASPATVARAEVLTVGEDAATVQEALDAASEGDVVEVPEGTWEGPVRIEERVTLRGTGGVIDGGGEGTVVVVAAPGAVIEGLRVRNSGYDLGAPDCCIYAEPSAIGAVVRDNDLSECAFGIWIHRGHESHVEDNRVQGRDDVREPDRGNGIHLFDGSHLVVRGNVVSGARDGIYVSATDDSLIADNRVEGQRYGVHYMYSHRNTVRGNESLNNLGGYALMESRELVVVDNVARGNSRHGLLFRDAVECEIRGNVLERNGQGMFFFSSTENVIEENRVSGNDVGAKVWAGSVRNRVSRNWFVGNRQQIFYVGTSDLVWGDGVPGNHWSNYTGWDQDGDGIGDRPHRVDSFTANTVYRYPAAVLLLRSPVMELLSHLQGSMPVLEVPTVIDRSPLVGEGETS